MASAFYFNLRPGERQGWQLAERDEMDHTVRELKYKQMPPFKRGDCVIDDNGEIGYCISDFTSAEWDAAGNLIVWHTRIRYRWDMPSYGKTRNVEAGEISAYVEKG
jgi:hypothetical protein